METAHYSAAKWLITRARVKNSLASKIKPAARDKIAAAMATALPASATDGQKTDWLCRYSDIAENQADFTGWVTSKDRDPSRLSAEENLALANGESLSTFARGK